MDRFQTQTSSELAHNHARSFAVRVWGDDTKPNYNQFCQDCREDVPELVEVQGYGKVCAICAPAAIEFMTAPEELTPVAAEVVSECCGAEFRYQAYSHGIDPETGYHDDGERCVCLACGNDTEPVMMAAFPRKPISRQQGELFAAVA